MYRGCNIRVCELSVGFYFVRRPLSLDTNVFSSNVIVEMVQFACRFAILCSCVWMATTMVPCFTGLSKPSWCKVAIPQELEQARFHGTCENSMVIGTYVQADVIMSMFGAGLEQVLGVDGSGFIM